MNNNNSTNNRLENSFNRRNNRTSNTNNPTRDNQITLRCFYCNRVGHTEDNCFCRQRDIRNQQNNNSNATSGSAISQDPHDTVASGPKATFTITPRKEEITLQCLVDTGAFACFLDKKYADRHSIKYLPDPEITVVHGINGTSTVYGITDNMSITSGKYTSNIKFYVIDLKNYTGIIGFNWIKDNHITFSCNGRTCFKLSRNEIFPQDLPTFTSSPLKICDLNLF